MSLSQEEIIVSNKFTGNKLIKNNFHKFLLPLIAIFVKFVQACSSKIAFLHQLPEGG